MATTIDITGNWREGQAFLPHIQVREPELPKSELRTFRQTLRLPRGRHSIRLHYDVELDRKPLQALGGNAGRFQGLRSNGQICPLDFVDGFADAEIRVDDAEAFVELELSLHNTRPLRTWLIAAESIAGSAQYRAVPPAGEGEMVVAHGVPFLASKLEFVHLRPMLDLPARAPLRSWHNGLEFDCGGASIGAIHFLGMIHSIDLANGSWYSPKGDHGYSHFVGDKAGEIVIHGAEGEETIVPLIFGFNLWYGRPWDILWANEAYASGPAGENCDARLFGGQSEFRDIIRDGVALVDGVRLMGARSCNARYIFSLKLNGGKVRAISVRGVPELHGHPLISAVTVESSDLVPALHALQSIADEDPRLNSISIQDASSGTFWPAVKSIMRALYSFTSEAAKLSQPEIPQGYFGPRYDFQPTQDAISAATYLYRNGPECATHCPEGGTTCASKTAGRNLTHYTLGMGVWREDPAVFSSIENWFGLYEKHEPGALLKTVWPGFKPAAWSRGMGELLRETVALGYDKFASHYVDWMDLCLMTEANPPHWNRVPGEPDTCTTTRKVGDTIEKGNRENDGHGICMWGRYLFWHGSGRCRKWNGEHWNATQAAVEWIQWQLDTDRLFPGPRKDVLYTESECAHDSYDIYSSYNCLHGIKLSIRMAEQIGRNDVAARWRTLYKRLRRGILEHLVDETPDGPLWHTDPDTDWQDHAHKLVHIHLSTDGDSYTPLQDYAAGDEDDRRYLEISRNTYRVLMKEKNYDCMRMLGYGQGMMIQAALLLDEMADAEQFIRMLGTHCYLPRLNGWTAPEGIVIHCSGEYYVAVNGYMGQDSHLADSVKGLRLMLGVDDNDPNHLRLVPRFPESWLNLSVSDIPALTGDSRQKLRYHYERKSDRQSFAFGFEHSVKRLSVRLGPIPKGESALSAMFNGKSWAYETQQSGDSHWIWIRDLHGLEGHVNVMFGNAGHAA